VGFDASDITAANGSVSGLTATADPLAFTATFTASSPSEGTGSVSVNPSSYSNAAGNPGSGSTDTVAIDTAPPAPTITLDANITSDDILNIAETGQNIPVTGVVGGDAEVGDTVTLTVNGKSFTGLVLAGKFSIDVPGADLAADADKTVDASVTTTDAAGNSASSSDTESYWVAGSFRGRQYRGCQPQCRRHHLAGHLHLQRSRRGLPCLRHHRRQWLGLGPDRHLLIRWCLPPPLPPARLLKAQAPSRSNPSSYSNAAGNPGSGLTDTVAIDTAPPAPTITLDANITSDDILNIAETGQNIPVTGVVGGDAKVGDTVTLTVNGKSFTGLVLAGSFSIDVPRCGPRSRRRQDRWTPPSPPPTPQATPPAAPIPSPTRSQAPLPWSSISWMPASMSPTPPRRSPSPSAKPPWALMPPTSPPPMARSSGLTATRRSAGVYRDLYRQLAF